MYTWIILFLYFRHSLTATYATRQTNFSFIRPLLPWRTLILRHILHIVGMGFFQNLRSDISQYLDGFSIATYADRQTTPALPNQSLKLKTQNFKLEENQKM